MAPGSWRGTCSPRWPEHCAAQHHHSQRYDERLLKGWHLAAGTGPTTEMAENAAQHNTIIRNATMSACWMDGICRQLALLLLAEVSENMVQHNTIIRNATMSACWIDGIWQQALDLLTEIDEDTVQRNTITCNARMSACWADGNGSYR